MKKTQKNLYLLYMIFGVMLVTANAIAAKVFNTGLSLFGSPITLTVGAICYPFTFLITDIIGEIWGKAEARTAVLGGFICQAISTIFIIAARYLPAVDNTMQNSYVALLGQNWIFVIASLSAFWVSQSWDVYIFHKIRNAYIAKHGSRDGGRWIWNNVGTISSQLIDSVLYAGIAFGLGFGWLFDSAMRPMLGAMIFGQWLIKMIIALLDTPLFYFFTRRLNTDAN